MEEKTKILLDKINIDENSYQYFNSAKINKIKVNSKIDSWLVFIEIDDLLPVEVYSELEEKKMLLDKNASSIEFIFDVKDVEEKYYLSEKVAKYVLAGGTKNFKTSKDTDLPIARPLLHSMHKMHRAGVDNYVTHKGRIRKLTPRECLRLMGFKDSFKIVVSDTSMYQQAGNSIVVDVLIAILKQLDITKYGKK